MTYVEPKSRYGTPDYRVPSHQVLTRGEMAKVLQDLRRRSRKSLGAMQYLVIFRLLACCGLRVSEVSGLNLDDVRLTGAKPNLRIRPETSKGDRGRVVEAPAWDAATLSDLVAWQSIRASQGARAKSPFICTTMAGKAGHRMDRHNIYRKWKHAIRPLGEGRVDQLPAHAGRHTFISHALRFRTLAEVRDTAGHASVAMTSRYLHQIIDDAPRPDVFADLDAVAA